MDFRDNAAVGMTPYMEFHMPRSAGCFYKMGPPGRGRAPGGPQGSRGSAHVAARRQGAACLRRGAAMLRRYRAR